jgi:neutral ceramidase
MLKAGAAQADISPTRPMFLYGYPHVPRLSTGVHDPLRAAALYLGNGQEGLLLIAVDILFVSHDSAARCRAALTAQTGVPQSHILISATHTHSGPVTADYLAFQGDPVVPQTDPAYLAYFESRIIQAGIRAWENREPAEVASVSAAIEGVGGYRLHQEGPADREAGILVVRKAGTHAPIAINVVYSMHPTVMHEDTTLVSADFPGYTKMRLAEAFPGIISLYHTGPSGNQSPRYSVTGQTFAEAERLGGLLAAPIVARVKAIPDSAFDRNPILSAAAGSVVLEPRTFMSLKKARENLIAKVSEYERLKREGAPHGPVRTAECTVFGAEELVVLAEAQENGSLRDWQRRYERAELQVLRCGSVCLAALPGEVFVEYGLEIKRRAALKTWVVSLANGELQGYIVTPEAEKEGGYEAQCGFFKASNGARMADELVRLIGTLA